MSLTGIIGGERRAAIVGVTVTINKQAGQADPASAGPILYDVVFSTSVTGFTNTDVSFTGSSVGGTLAAGVGGSGTTYVVSVTGMTSAGNVVVSIPAGVVSPSNSASTSTDNVVAYNPAPAASWYDLFTPTLTTDSAGWGDYTMAQYVAPANYAAGAPATGTKLRVTVKPASTTGANWSGAYVGHVAASGDVIDFDGTQVQELTGGAASGSTAAGVSKLLDEVTYAFDKTKGLVFRAHFVNSPGTDMKAVAGGSGQSRAYALDGADSYVGLTNVTVGGGFFDLTAGVYFVEKIEVYG